MKRLIAYLFIVLGLGLILNINANADTQISKKEKNSQTINVNDEAIEINPKYLYSLNYEEKIKISKSLYKGAKKSFKEKKIVRGCSQLYQMSILSTMDDKLLKKVKKNEDKYNCTQFNFAASISNKDTKKIKNAKLLCISERNFVEYRFSNISCNANERLIQKGSEEYYKALAFIENKNNPSTQIAKKEPSKTQKVAKKTEITKKKNIDKYIVDIIHCQDKNLKTGKFFEYSRASNSIRTKDCAKGYYGKNKRNISHEFALALRYNKKFINKQNRNHFNFCFKPSVGTIFPFNTEQYKHSPTFCSDNMAITLKYDGKNYYYYSDKVSQFASKELIKNKKINKSKKIAKKENKKDEKSLWDKLKKSFNDTFNKNQKPKKIIQKLKPKKIEPKIVEKPKSPFELKVLATLKEEKKNTIKCEINEKPNIFKGEKLNLCIKKSDIIKLGEYKQFNEYPKQMISKIKGCKTETCLGKEAGQRVYKTFVQRSERYHAKYPGEIIHGMAWFEILYLDKLKKTQKALQRYNNNQYDGLYALRKTTDKKQIYSLIKMNNSRIKMRNALGMTLYDDLQIVIKNQWLLGDFLNNDKLKVKKVKINPELKKRKLLLEKYKSTLARYKKKLEEKNIN